MNLAVPFTDDDIGSLVVNGTNSNIENYPYMVSVRRVTGAHMCGGTLLNLYWVLTAAHCLMNSPASYYRIQHSSTEISPDETVNITIAAETIRHPNYDPENSHLHDIGLIRVNILVFFFFFDEWSMNSYTELVK